MGPASKKLKRHKATTSHEKNCEKKISSGCWRLEHLLLDDRSNCIPGQCAADNQQSSAKDQLNQQNNQVMFLATQLATRVRCATTRTGLG